MEFWGVEVKAGKPLKVQLDDGIIIHISQAAIGESKKGADSVPLFVKFDEKKLVLGHLSTEKFPQIPFDLVFEKEFELSHNWTGGSVYFTGYKTFVAEEDDFSDLPSDSEEEELPIGLEENGKTGAVAAPKKVEDAARSKSSVNPKASEAVKGKEDEDEDDSDEEYDNDLNEDSDEEDESESESDDEEEESEEEEEETPKKVETGKKRANGSASKTSDAKKAKLATPLTDGKKNGVHIATPYPAKQGAKTPAGNKKQQQSPKSAGSVAACNSCSKTFNSEAALQSHSKAKHGAK